MMDRRLLSRIDEELDSTEVAELCFLCRDVISGKRLEGIKDAKQLFLKLEERELLQNKFFLTQLLRTIHRADLLNLIETDSTQTEETDARPLLSEYRVMLHKIYDDMTEENLGKFKFLYNNEQRRKMEMCNTALDVFVEMEKVGSLSNTNLTELYEILVEIDQQLASTVQKYIQRLQQQQHSLPVSVDPQAQRVNNTRQPQPFLSMPETQPSYGAESVYSDAQSTSETPSLSDSEDHYDLTHNPRGLCVVINNEDFTGPGLQSRRGTQEDAKALDKVFTNFGFKVEICNNLTARDMRAKMQKLGERNFMNDDALVVCVLSHGENNERVYGTDEELVFLRDLTLPFKSGRAPTLAGKPKLFFIQACQGSKYQEGAVPCPPTSAPEEVERTSRLEEDAGPVRSETVPWDADFLIGMATVPECKSFRNTVTGSIYIQELCRQLTKSALSSEKDDILTVLTRVNREVSRGRYLTHKQMPQPKYTLTKKLVLKYV